MLHPGFPKYNRFSIQRLFMLHSGFQRISRYSIQRSFSFSLHPGSRKISRFFQPILSQVPGRSLPLKTQGSPSSLPPETSRVVAKIPARKIIFPSPAPALTGGREREKSEGWEHPLSKFLSLFPSTAPH